MSSNVWLLTHLAKTIAAVSSLQKQGILYVWALHAGAIVEGLTLL